MNKKLLLLTLITAGAVTAYGAGQIANAQTPTGKPFSGLVQTIAQKFNLDQNKVQEVVDQYRQQHKTGRMQNLNQKLGTRLNSLVNQGKLNEQQKQAVMKEFAALENKYNVQSTAQTPQQRMQAFQNLKNEFDIWAKQQGIDPALIMPRFGMGKRWGWE